MKRTSFWIILTGILLLCSVAFYFLSLPSHWEDAYAEEGTVDLRNLDFEKNLYSLRGQWEFYYGKLWTEEDFTAGSVEVGDYLTIPSDWSLEGYPLYGCGTYRLRILTQERQLTMLIPEIPDASRIFIDGIEVFAAGKVSESKEGFVPSVRNAFVTFDTGDGDAEIIIQVANFDWAESGMRYDLMIARPSVMFRDGILRRVMLALFIGATLMMGFYHAALYVASRQEKVYALFAAMCLLLAVRFFLETNGFAQLFLPGGLDNFLTRIYMLLVPLGFGLIIRFTALVFGLEQSKKRSSVIFYYAYRVVIILSVIMAVVAPSFYMFGALLLLPLLWVLFLAIRTGRAKDKPYMTLYLVAIGIFCSWGMMTKLFWGDRLYMAGIPSNLFLLLSQCVMLAFDYGRAKRHAVELAERNRFLDNLSRMKTEYLANLTHEMKTPLTVVSLNLQRAMRNLPEDKGEKLQRVKESIASAKKETLKVATMAQTALDLAFAEESQSRIEVLDLRELLIQSEKQFHPVAERKNNIMILQIPHSLPPVLGDGFLLSGAVSNLLSNACTATTNGNIILSAKADSDFVTVTVFNDGATIPSEILGREFERGVSGSGGTGLGLTITRETIEIHGGTITLQNKEGGVLATFTIPITREKEEMRSE